MDLIEQITGSAHGHLGGTNNALGSRLGIGNVRASAFQFFNVPRWSRTATNQAPSNGPNALRQGDPITLTWSILPDGTPLAASGSIPAESSDPSNLIAHLNGIYGNQTAWIALMQQVFDRWAEVSGIRYIYEPNDDGTSFPGSEGVLGTRGDVRVGGHRIDGSFNTLAYNYGPPTGDMVIDTSDGYFNTTSSNSLRLRNVLAHEHGHGIGLEHVCPINQTKLMEPKADTAFDGPQHDDIFSAQRQYGDRFEDSNADANSDDNDAFARRTNLGTLNFGTTTLTPLSIDDNSDQDYLGFGSGTSGAGISITLRPLGSSYLEGGQNNDGTCSAGTNFNSKAVHNLGFALFDSGGNRLLTRDATASGNDETIADFTLPAGTQFAIRVFGDSTNNAQLYELEIELTDPDAPPDITIGDSSALEATGAIGFSVQLSEQSAADVTVSYAIQALTASDGDDFTPASGTATVSAGNLTAPINVSIIDDLLDENDETLRVTLSDPLGGVLVDAVADGTILDDDSPPLMSVDDAQVSETAGSVDVPVTLDAPSGLAITAVISSRSGSATAGDDFTAANNFVSFAPGDVSRIFTVPVLDDSEAEADETFLIQLVNSSNATLGDASATVTILDDDALEQLSGTGSLAGDAPSGGISIAWKAVIGRDYTILFSTDLVNWDPLAGAELITADEVDESFAHSPRPEFRGFYRIVEGYSP